MSQSAHPEKVDHSNGLKYVEDAASIEKNSSPYTNLTALAQAAVTEKSYTPFQAVRIYWKATIWCLFMCMGALLWGYDSQVSTERHATHKAVLNAGTGRRRLAQCPILPARLRVSKRRRRGIHLGGKMAERVQ